MRYTIEHRIHTLAENAIMDKTAPPPWNFTAEGIAFSHWEFNYRDGWLQDFWMAKGDVEAASGIDAINAFRRKLDVVTARVALISQSYIDYTTEPWLLTKGEGEIALYHRSIDRKGGGLMFMEKDREALDLLLVDKDVPHAFYKYWKDAVNSIGYSPKLLLMFSALESLVRKHPGEEKWIKMREILGDELTQDLFGTKGNSRSALRNRLVHGEHFQEGDFQKDYLELVHKRVLAHFNQAILLQDLLELNVVHPQRHYAGNKETTFIFLQKKSSVDLKELIANFNESKKSENYEVIFPENDFRVAF